MEEVKDDHALNLVDMCRDANERHKRYKNERTFKDLLGEVHYVPFAVYLYHKVEGVDPGSAYLNDLYLFKRIAGIIQ